MLSIRVAVRAGLLVVVGGLSMGASAQPEPAPPPREQPSYSDLIVGRWKWTRYGGLEFPKGASVIEEYTKDAKLSITTVRPGLPATVSSWSYKITNKTLEIKAITPAAGKIATLQIVSLTTRELVRQHGKQDDFKMSELIRLPVE